MTRMIISASNLTMRTPPGSDRRPPHILHSYICGHRTGARFLLFVGAQLLLEIL